MIFQSLGVAIYFMTAILNPFVFCVYILIGAPNTAASKIFAKYGVETFVQKGFNTYSMNLVVYLLFSLFFYTTLFFLYYLLLRSIKNISLIEYADMRVSWLSFGPAMFVLPVLNQSLRGAELNGLAWLLIPVFLGILIQFILLAKQSWPLLRT